MKRRFSQKERQSIYIKLILLFFIPDISSLMLFGYVLKRPPADGALAGFVFFSRVFISTLVLLIYIYISLSKEENDHE